ncbi:hypothetical protein M8J75_012644 [Diaphorina citri]|nr:hypothetical protein M8J75_012644 [Diaphorina citri]KAI5742711.1 hypothetical protein M8J77_010397 [Diaphorina citri]
MLGSNTSHLMDRLTNQYRQNIGTYSGTSCTNRHLGGTSSYPGSNNAYPGYDYSPHQYNQSWNQYNETSSGGFGRSFQNYSSRFSLYYGATPLSKSFSKQSPWTMNFPESAARVKSLDSRNSEYSSRNSEYSSRNSEYSSRNSHNVERAGRQSCDDGDYRMDYVEQANHFIRNNHRVITSREKREYSHNIKYNERHIQKLVKKVVKKHVREEIGSRKKKADIFRKPSEEERMNEEHKSTRGKDNASISGKTSSTKISQTPSTNNSDRIENVKTSQKSSVGSKNNSDKVNSIEVSQKSSVNKSNFNKNDNSKTVQKSSSMSENHSIKSDSTKNIQTSSENSLNKTDNIKPSENHSNKIESRGVHYEPSKMANKGNIRNRWDVTPELPKERVENGKSGYETNGNDNVLRENDPSTKTNIDNEMRNEIAKSDNSGSCETTNVSKVAKSVESTAIDKSKTKQQNSSSKSMENIDVSKEVPNEVKTITTSRDNCTDCKQNRTGSNDDRSIIDNEPEIKSTNEKEAKINAKDKSNMDCELTGDHVKLKDDAKSKESKGEEEDIKIVCQLGAVEKTKSILREKRRKSQSEKITCDKSKEKTTKSATSHGSVEAGSKTPTSENSQSTKDNRNEQKESGTENTATAENERVESNSTDLESNMDAITSNIPDEDSTNYLTPSEINREKTENNKILGKDDKKEEKSIIKTLLVHEDDTNEELPYIESKEVILNEVICTIADEITNETEHLKSQVDTAEKKDDTASKKKSENDDLENGLIIITDNKSEGVNTNDSKDKHSMIGVNDKEQREQDKPSDENIETIDSNEHEEKVPTDLENGDKVTNSTSEFTAGMNMNSTNPNSKHEALGDENNNDTTKENNVFAEKKKTKRKKKKYHKTVIEAKSVYREYKTYESTKQNQSLDQEPGADFVLKYYRGNYQHPMNYHQCTNGSYQQYNFYGQHCSGKSADKNHGSNKNTRFQHGKKYNGERGNPHIQNKQSREKIKRKIKKRSNKHIPETCFGNVDRDPRRSEVNINPPSSIFKESCTCKTGATCQNFSNCCRETFLNDNTSNCIAIAGSDKIHCHCTKTSQCQYCIAMLHYQHFSHQDTNLSNPKVICEKENDSSYSEEKSHENSSSESEQELTNLIINLVKKYKRTKKHPLKRIERRNHKYNLDVRTSNAEIYPENNTEPVEVSQQSVLFEPRPSMKSSNYNISEEILKQHETFVKEKSKTHNKIKRRPSDSDKTTDIKQGINPPKSNVKRNSSSNKDILSNSKRMKISIDLDSIGSDVPSLIKHLKLSKPLHSKKENNSSSICSSPKNQNEHKTGGNKDSCEKQKESTASLLQEAQKKCDLIIKHNAIKRKAAIPEENVPKKVHLINKQTDETTSSQRENIHRIQIKNNILDEKFKESFKKNRCSFNAAECENTNVNNTSQMKTGVSNESEKTAENKNFSVHSTRQSVTLKPILKRRSSLSDSKSITTTNQAPPRRHSTYLDWKLQKMSNGSNTIDASSSNSDSMEKTKDLMPKHTLPSLPRNCQNNNAKSLTNKESSSNKEIKHVSFRSSLVDIINPERSTNIVDSNSNNTTERNGSTLKNIKSDQNRNHNVREITAVHPQTNEETNRSDKGEIITNKCKWGLQNYIRLGQNPEKTKVVTASKITKGKRRVSRVNGTADDQNNSNNNDCRSKSNLTLEEYLQRKNCKDVEQTLENPVETKNSNETELKDDGYNNTEVGKETGVTSKYSSIQDYIVKQSQTSPSQTSLEHVTKISNNNQKPTGCPIEKENDNKVKRKEHGSQQKLVQIKSQATKSSPNIPNKPTNQLVSSSLKDKVVQKISFDPRQKSISNNTFKNNLKEKASLAIPMEPKKPSHHLPNSIRQPIKSASHKSSLHGDHLKKKLPEKNLTNSRLDTTTVSNQREKMDSDPKGVPTLPVNKIPTPVVELLKRKPIIEDKGTDKHSLSACKPAKHVSHERKTSQSHSVPKPKEFPEKRQPNQKIAVDSIDIQQGKVNSELPCLWSKNESTLTPITIPAVVVEDSLKSKEVARKIGSKNETTLPNITIPAAEDSLKSKEIAREKETVEEPYEAPKSPKKELDDIQLPPSITGNQLAPDAAPVTANTSEEPQPEIATTVLETAQENIVPKEESEETLPNTEVEKSIISENHTQQTENPLKSPKRPYEDVSGNEPKRICVETTRPSELVESHLGMDCPLLTPEVELTTEALLTKAQLDYERHRQEELANCPTLTSAFQTPSAKEPPVTLRILTPREIVQRYLKETDSSGIDSADRSIQDASLNSSTGNDQFPNNQVIPRNLVNSNENNLSSGVATAINNNKNNRRPEYLNASGNFINVPPASSQALNSANYAIPSLPNDLPFNSRSMHPTVLTTNVPSSLSTEKPKKKREPKKKPAANKTQKKQVATNNRHPSVQLPYSSDPGAPSSQWNAQARHIRANSADEYISLEQWVGQNRTSAGELNSYLQSYAEYLKARSMTEGQNMEGMYSINNRSQNVDPTSHTQSYRDNGLNPGVQNRPMAPNVNPRHEDYAAMKNSMWLPNTLSCQTSAPGQNEPTAMVAHNPNGNVHTPQHTSQMTSSPLDLRYQNYNTGTLQNTRNPILQISSTQNSTFAHHQNMANLPMSNNPPYGNRGIGTVQHDAQTANPQSFCSYYPTNTGTLQAHNQGSISYNNASYQNVNGTMLQSNVQICASQINQPRPNVNTETPLNPVQMPGSEMNANYQNSNPFNYQNTSQVSTAYESYQGNHGAIQNNTRFLSHNQNATSQICSLYQMVHGNTNQNMSQESFHSCYSNVNPSTNQIAYQPPPSYSNRPMSGSHMAPTNQTGSVQNTNQVPASQISSTYGNSNGVLHNMQMPRVLPHQNINGQSMPQVNNNAHNMTSSMVYSDPGNYNAQIHQNMVNSQQNAMSAQTTPCQKGKARAPKNKTVKQATQTVQNSHSNLQNGQPSSISVSTPQRSPHDSNRSTIQPQSRKSLGKDAWVLKYLLEKGQAVETTDPMQTTCLGNAQQVSNPSDTSLAPTSVETTNSTFITNTTPSKAQPETVSDTSSKSASKLLYSTFEEWLNMCFTETLIATRPVYQPRSVEKASEEQDKFVEKSPSNTDSSNIDLDECVQVEMIHENMRTSSEESMSSAKQIPNSEQVPTVHTSTDLILNEKNGELENPPEKEIDGAESVKKKNRVKHSNLVKDKSANCKEKESPKKQDKQKVAEDTRKELEPKRKQDTHKVAEDTRKELEPKRKQDTHKVVEDTRKELEPKRKQDTHKVAEDTRKELEPKRKQVSLSGGNNSSATKTPINFDCRVILSPIPMNAGLLKSKPTKPDEKDSKKTTPEMEYVDTIIVDSEEELEVESPPVSTLVKTPLTSPTEQRDTASDKVHGFVLKTNTSVVQNKFYNMYNPCFLILSELRQCKNLNDRDENTMNSCLLSIANILNEMFALKIEQNVDFDSACFKKIVTRYAKSSKVQLIVILSYYQDEVYRTLHKHIENTAGYVIASYIDVKRCLLELIWMSRNIELDIPQRGELIKYMNLYKKLGTT